MDVRLFFKLTVRKSTEFTELSITATNVYKSKSNHLLHCL